MYFRTNKKSKASIDHQWKFLLHLLGRNGIERSCKSVSSSVLLCTCIWNILRKSALCYIRNIYFSNVLPSSNVFSESPLRFWDLGEIVHAVILIDLNWISTLSSLLYLNDSSTLSTQDYPFYSFKHQSSFYSFILHFRFSTNSIYSIS